MAAIDLKKFLVILIVCVCGSIYSVNAQNYHLGVYAYPTEGQSEQQQQDDATHCERWAEDETGVNPNDHFVINENDNGTEEQTVKRSVEGGIIGGIAGGHAGKGAAIGAAEGAIEGHARKKQAQNEEAAVNEAYADHYKRAYSSCMEGNGYSIK